MTTMRAVETVAASGQFITHSPETGRWSRSDDRKANAPSTTPAVRRGSDSSDQAQAQFFAAMLTVEIETVSVLVDDAEHLARKAGRVGHGAARLWHNEEARSKRKLLYELHRQLDALRRRFPDVSG